MKKLDRNLNGQEMRNKGRRTRQRILEATAQLMATVPIRDLRTIDIGRIAKVSKATFYTYFESVEDAALAVVQGLNQSTPEIMAILESEWNGDNVLEKVDAFVTEYIDYWAAKHALLRLRNFAADEGDQRFFKARRDSIEPIHLAIQSKIRALQERGISPRSLHPASTSSVFLAMIERVSAVIRLPSAHGATVAGEKQCAATVIASTLAPMAMAQRAQADPPASA